MLRILETLETLKPNLRGIPAARLGQRRGWGSNTEALTAPILVYKKPKKPPNPSILKP